MAGRTYGRKNAPTIPTNSLVASAVRLGGEEGRVAPIFRGQVDWQKEAWRQYAICPELRFAAGWIGNALSRCRLLPGEVDALGNIIRSEDAATAKALQNLFSGNNGQAQMLSSLGIHLTIAGEAYLVGRAEPGQEGLFIWEVVGVNELTVTGPIWTLKYGDGMNSVQLDRNKDVVIRIWRPHPAYRVEADSPVRSLLPTLTEIEYLTRHIFAQTTSRIAGAGVWLLPDTLEFPGSDGSTNKAESFMKMIGTAMSQSLQDPGDPSSLVPVIGTVPGAEIPHIKPPIQFWSQFDSAAVATRLEAIARFCVGMDLPPEVIKGMTASGSSSGGRGTGASHWTSWQIEEAAIKLHIEPLLELIGNGITIAYLRVVVKGKPNCAIMYDTTSLKLQPDRSKEAAELYDRDELSPDALRLYSGFGPDDAPTDVQRKNMILAKIAGGSATPDQVAWALGELGITGAPDGMGQEPVHPGTNQRQAPSLIGHPSRGTPDQAALVLAMAEPLVLRALERVGGRLRNKGIKPPDTPASEVHCFAHINGNATEMLEGAWSQVAVCADGYDVDAVQLTRVLNAYTENLLHEKVPHSREALRNYLALMS